MPVLPGDSSPLCSTVPSGEDLDRKKTQTRFLCHCKQGVCKHTFTSFGLSHHTEAKTFTCSPFIQRCAWLRVPQISALSGRCITVVTEYNISHSTAFTLPCVQCFFTWFLCNSPGTCLVKNMRMISMQGIWDYLTVPRPPAQCAVSYIKMSLSAV